MKSSHLLIVTLVAVCLFAVSSIATSQNQRSQQSQNQRQISYEYATMNSQANQESNGMVYTVTWNAGVQDIIGRSNSSIDDAMRRLTAQLGGTNNSRTNLSVLLSTVGANGWRLIESNQNDFGMTRIFIRGRSSQ